MTETERVELVFDTFAWLEEVGDGPHAETVERLHYTKRVGTPLPVLAEISHVYAARAPEALERVLATIISTSTTMELTPAIAIAAGRTRAALARNRKGIGLVDCIILETARAHDARLVTGDPHLKGLEGVDFLS